MKNFIKNYPLFTSILFTAIIGPIGSFIYEILNKFINGYEIKSISELILSSLGLCFVIYYPLVLTALEIIFFILTIKKKVIAAAWRFDQTALWYGLFLELNYLWFFKDITGWDWMLQLSNAEKHIPIYSGSLLTIFIIALLALVGFLYLSLLPIEKMPPLTAVLAISAMYLGVIEIVIFTIQVIWENTSDTLLDCMLLLWPICIVMMVARTILIKVHEWSTLPIEKRKISENKMLRRMDQLLLDSRFWPIWALILALPLLGILIGILLLFGQAPDSVVKAWTETADWRLSTKQAPQNIYYDEHYLCTVAAGGHRNIVKPTRMGIRHGHPVIVNRQLLVANAFEQVLEEKTPGFHRQLRNFYDHYGFPIAKMIRRQWIADLIYFLMKPLEWLFLIVLYMTDLHPENRIAVQYMGDVPEYRK